jgi:RNA polymerase sigma factor (sigma-70 family)
MRSRSGATLAELEAVYRARFAAFCRVAAGIVGDRDLARDVVQEAFGTAIRRRTTYQRRGPLEAWLWRLVVNTARDHRQLRARSATVAVESPSTNGHADSADAVAAAVSLLPERQRLVLFLRYYADLEYAAIADALGIRAGTVAATLSAAHAAVRRALEEVPHERR